MSNKNNISNSNANGLPQVAVSNVMVLSLLNFSVRPSLRTFRP